MQSHSSGCIKGSRPGANINRQTWQFLFNALTTGVSVKLATIPAGTLNPAAYKVRILNLAVSDAVTSDQLQVGTSSGATDIILNANLKNAAGQVITHANDFILVKADTEVWITEAIVGTKTVGEFYIILEAFEINVKAPDNQT